MKYLKVLTVPFIFILVSSSLIFLYFELEPYSLNPFEYSRYNGDKYMIFAPLYVFLCIASLLFNIQKFYSLRFSKGIILRAFKLLDLSFTMILILSSLLIIFCTDIIPTDNNFAMSFFIILILLSVLNLIDNLRFKIY